jgi:hypothetical protein
MCSSTVLLLSSKGLSPFLFNLAVPGQSNNLHGFCTVSETASYCGYKLKEPLLETAASSAWAADTKQKALASNNLSKVFPQATVATRS